jgi:beta-lactamase regulating signal transducer with metallopeptidase domain
VETLLELGLRNAILVTVLAFVVAWLAFLCRRRPAVVHALWLLVLLKFLVPALYPVEIPGLPQFPIKIEQTISQEEFPVTTDGGESSADFDKTVPDEAGGTGVSPVNQDAGPTPSPGEQEPGIPDPALNVKAEGQARQSLPLATPPEESSMIVPAAGTEDEGSIIEDRGSATEDSSDPSRSSILHPRSSGSPPLWTPSWQAVVASIWLTGSFAWLTIVGIRVLRFQRLLRYAKPSSGEIRERARTLAEYLGMQRCPEILLLPAPLSPLVWALGRRARLLIPEALWARLTEEQRQTLLVHELAHLRRGDHWVRRLELFVTALYWWHPVVWWAQQQLRQAEEQCCDAWVVWALPAAGQTYATMLVETLAFLSKTQPALPLGASGIEQVQQLKRRLAMIMNGTAPRAMSRAAFCAVLGIGALLLPLLPTPAQPSPDQQTVAAEDNTLLIGIDQSGADKIVYYLRQGERGEVKKFSDKEGLLREVEKALQGREGVEVRIKAHPETPFEIVRDISENLQKFQGDGRVARLLGEVNDKQAGEEPAPRSPRADGQHGEQTGPGPMSADPRPYGEQAPDLAEQLEAARDEVDLVQAQLAIKKAEIGEAEAQIKHAERTWAKLKDLYDKGGASIQDFSQARSDLELRKAQLETKRAQLREVEVCLSQAARRAERLQARLQRPPGGADKQGLPPGRPVGPGAGLPGRGAPGGPGVGAPGGRGIRGGIPRSPGGPAGGVGGAGGGGPPAAEGGMMPGGGLGRGMAGPGGGMMGPMPGMRGGASMMGGQAGMPGYSASALAPGWANELFEERSWDFGTVRRGEKPSHTFRLTNPVDWNHVVRIKDVRVSAAFVTVVSWTPILSPGDSADINVQMDTRKFSGDKTANIYVQFDQPAQATLRLQVQADSRDTPAFMGMKSMPSEDKPHADSQKIQELERKVDRLIEDMHVLRNALSKEGTDKPPKESRQ